MSTFSDEFAEKLFEVFDTAKEEKVAELYKLLADYRSTYPRSYAKLKTKPFSGAVIIAVEEAHNYLNEVG
jgi:hypothetical protein